MAKSDSDRLSRHSQDKQLASISIEAAMEKRRLDQALNAKEFALCAGVSYSVARQWFHLPGFPVFHGVVFWQDFVHWREAQTRAAVAQDMPIPTENLLPPRAASILQEASQP